MSETRWSAVAAVIAVTLLPAGWSTAQERSADELAIRKTAAAYLEAFNKGDLKTLRSFWTDNGNLVDELGISTSVKEMAQAAGSTVDESSANAPQLKVQTESIRFITPTVAIEDGTSELASTAGGQATRGRYSVVWVKEDGKWLIDAVREAAIGAVPTTSQMDELGWMVGQWAEKGDRAAFSAKFQWSDDKNFVVGKLRVQPRENESHAVTQRIGWDAAMGKIRSWNFDSGGGFSEGVWSREGEGWSIATSGVLPDGRRTRGRRILKRIDDDTVLLASVDFQIDGEPLPDLIVTLVRK